MPKYPYVSVNWSNIDGNAFSLIGSVVKGLRKAKVDPVQITEFRQEALSSDYDNVMDTCARWVTIHV